MTTINLDETHDPALKSWVAGADSSDFPLQNLPFGVFGMGTSGAPRAGMAIGDQIFDFTEALGRGLLQGEPAKAAQAAGGGLLNELMALGRAPAASLRLAVSRLLRSGAARQSDTAACLRPMTGTQMLVPARVGNFTDFYTSIHHATNAGKLFRPDNPLLPNYKYLPMAYHGRASSVAVSGTPCRRPLGQSKPKDAPEPIFGASNRLDYELEVGFYVGAGNALGEPVPLAEADDHLFGVCLVNDWSARDIQAWEYQPLGPFLGKSFLTSVSPWIVTLDALAPYRVPAVTRAAGDPPLMAHLDTPGNRALGGLDIRLEVLLQTRRMREAGLAPQRLGKPRFADQYWTIAQMLAHHASNGCNLMPGDLMGSGTVSGPNEGEAGCLLEMTLGGAKAFDLPGGEQRRFLEDGDEVIFRAHCEGAGRPRIGFGECRGVVVAAV